VRYEHARALLDVDSRRATVIGHYATADWVDTVDLHCEVEVQSTVDDIDAHAALAFCEKLIADLDLAVTERISTMHYGQALQSGKEFRERLAAVCLPSPPSAIEVTAVDEVAVVGLDGETWRQIPTRFNA
jgi:hypothetical protein